MGYGSLGSGWEAAHSSPVDIIALQEGSTLYDPNPAGVEKPFALTVAKSGKTAQLLWWCGHVKNLNSRAKATVAISSDGAFSYHAGNSSYTIWQIKGRFVSATEARVTLQVPSTCDGKGGTVKLTVAS